MNRRSRSRAQSRSTKRTKTRRNWLLRVFVFCIMLSLVPVVVLRWVAPPTSSVMLQRILLDGDKLQYEWVPIERIAPAASLAVVAAEDQKFPDHWGFDTQAIQNAVETWGRGGRLRGASTLTQQVARNLFLWQGRSYARKALEAWFTLLLELVWPKQRILEVYLNIAEMAPRTFGIQAASRRYFGKSAAALSPGEAALIAAVLPNPVRYRVDAPSEYVLSRRSHILQQMSQLGGASYLRDVLR